MVYAWMKLAHLFAVVLWIGPAIGAYYFLIRAYKAKDPARIVWCERVAERVLFAEHIALIAMIATGLGLVHIGPWSLTGTAWLKTKMILFGFVCVFEMFDMWLAHRVFKRLFAQDDPMADPQWARAERLRVALIVAAIPVGLGLIPGMFYLAIVKV